MSFESVTLPLYTVDAFTDVPFQGNQAAVCLDSKGLTVEQMQQMAAELNLPETAFLTVLEPEETYTTGRIFGIRWFTPTCEVPLCGHATLASAAVMFNVINNKDSELTFRTQSRGDLLVRRNGSRITMDLPTSTPECEKTETWLPLLDIMFGSLPIKEVLYAPPTTDLVVRLDDAITRKNLEDIPVPNGTTAMEAHSGKVKGVILTTSGESTPYDFYSRYFCPWTGSEEDPVTGAVHTALTPYWGIVLNKQTMLARQVSSRGGDLEVSLRADGRVDITGAATILVRGTITV